MSKVEYGSVLAASLAYLMHRQRDATGLIEFDDRITGRLPASARPGHLHAILLALDRIAPGKKSDVGRPLHQLAEALGKRSLAVLISDLLDDPETVVRGLKHLRFRGTDVIVFQVLDPHEIQFPFRGAARFTDVESHDEVTADPARVREGYLEAMDTLRARYEKELRGAGIDFLTLDTSKPLDFALLAYLDARGKGGSSMSFLNPLYLVGAALIALPIVLHLLRRDVAPPVPFTAVRLLRKTAVDRSRRHRLRDLLLLAARVCALLLLAASFARPYLAGGRGHRADHRGGHRSIVQHGDPGASGTGTHPRARGDRRAAGRPDCRHRLRRSRRRAGGAWDGGRCARRRGGCSDRLRRHALRRCARQGRRDPRQ